jgi:hypothetical protein
VRTTKRYTAELLDRFRREHRGIGIFENYIPWHRVGRGDPASRGRSHLIPWRERQREVLSDLEWVVLVFVTLMGDYVADIREQFPLALNERHHELGDYDIDAQVLGLPGTLALARAMQIKHPRVRGTGLWSHWIMTTDLLVTLRDKQGRLSLLALSCKYDEDARSHRARQLLSIEREYWLAREARWLLITPSLFEEAVALTLRRVTCWAFEESCSAAHRRLAAEVTFQCPGRSLTFVLQRLQNALGSMELAQCAFYQAVWSGEIPLDLRRTWRNHVPPTLLSREAFLALNPVASRRTAWI